MIRTHNKVSNAIKSGKMTPKPCVQCGNEKSVAHHDDYAKPLKVRWLCNSCHRAWHAKHKAKNKPTDGYAIIAIRVPIHIKHELSDIAWEKRTNVNSLLSPFIMMIAAQLTVKKLAKKAVL